MNAKYLDKIIPIVKMAGEIILSAENKRETVVEDIEVKSGASNYATIYDKAVEKYLFEKLGEAFPTSQFLGEEDDAPENVDERIKKGLWFVIDPIDGTTNFIHDFRNSAISVGLCENGKVVAGVIYNPYSDELFSAEKDCGAYLNGEPIHVTNHGMCEALVAFGTSPYHRELADRTFEEVKKLYLVCHDIRRSGTCAMDFAYIACGRCDFFYEITLNPWDYAAAIIIIKEAGGIITDFDCHELSLTKPSSVIAGNRKCYEQYWQIR